jgi:hypothetical protein
VVQQIDVDSQQVDKNNVDCQNVDLWNVYFQNIYCQNIEHQNVDRQTVNYVKLSTIKHKVDLLAWPNQLGCSFVTNIPLGAYLLRLGAHFQPSSLQLLGWVEGTVVSYLFHLEKASSELEQPELVIVTLAPCCDFRSSAMDRIDLDFRPRSASSRSHCRDPQRHVHLFARNTSFVRNLVGRQKWRASIFVVRQILICATEFDV